MKPETLIPKIFNISSFREFNEISLQIFHYQYAMNTIYREFVEHLHVRIEDVDSIEKIPFLPIEFFRNHKILATDRPVEKIFHSSGTTSRATSRHHLVDYSLYKESILKGFKHFYGRPDKYCFLALLPSYLERANASLVFMMKELMKVSSCRWEGFFLNNINDLKKAIKKVPPTGRTIFLLGVSFALLDLVEKHGLQVPETSVVMETGGMKGRRREIVRKELHGILAHGMGLSVVHSEYGMTELLSQAYAMARGLFYAPPWMKVLIRDFNDPLSFAADGRSGGINVIDLANIYSCSFIATQDIGKRHPDGAFEVLGRFDNSDIRGCNLLVT
ncbi:MAG: acyltransferase [Bacteroidales bacterium]|nr:acyltransferase [Bacteroidales bacterium]MCF8343726.1 acyltransferase [Bacteroidales bacterium]MCF8350450.1 acyltransferase [Bacteroidales bacterium]MCF8376199.1 acyltransferase [Bacteroidales bacterium]MCF8401135.1 acyltransferase [Bacteroidales bacterium]